MQSQKSHLEEPNVVTEVRELFGSQMYSIEKEEHIVTSIIGLDVLLLVITLLVIGHFGWSQVF